MHRAVVGILLRQPVPLAAGPQAEDERIECRPLVDPLRPAFGRVVLG
jgi:hypothetical protein